MIGWLTVIAVIVYLGVLNRMAALELRRAWKQAKDEF